MQFKAVEFKSESVEQTSREETYEAKNREEAVQMCLYTKKLSNRNAFVGASGGVVHTGKFSWSVVPVKEPVHS